MKRITVTCDKCGTTDFKRDNGYFEGSEVRINFDLQGSYVSEYEQNEYHSITLDLCSKCTNEFHQMIKDFIKNK